MLDTSLYSEIDYADSKQVLILLKFYGELKSKNGGDNYNETLGCILIDIEQALGAVGLTERQAMILDDVFDGMAEKEIAEKYGITRQMVAKQVIAVSFKVSRYLVAKKTFNE